MTVGRDVEELDMSEHERELGEVLDEERARRAVAALLSTCDRLTEVSNVVGSSCARLGLDDVYRAGGALGEATGALAQLVSHVDAVLGRIVAAGRLRDDEPDADPALRAAQARTSLRDLHNLLVGAQAAASRAQVCVGHLGQEPPPDGPPTPPWGP